MSGYLNYKGYWEADSRVKIVHFHEAAEMRTMSLEDAKRFCNLKVAYWNLYGFGLRVDDLSFLRQTIILWRTFLQSSYKITVSSTLCARLRGAKILEMNLIDIVCGSNCSSLSVLPCHRECPTLTTAGIRSFFGFNEDKLQK